MSHHRSSVSLALLAAALLMLATRPPMAQTAPGVQPSLLDRVEKAIGAVTGDPMARVDADMKRVLDTQADLRARPVGELTPLEARLQPSLADAELAVLTREKRDAAPERGVNATDILFRGAAGDLPARVYRPEGTPAEPLPVIAYFHGGGFVHGDVRSYDASARGLARRAQAVVISFHYRQAPEDKFPAAYDDAVAAYRWLMGEASRHGADPNRVVVAGEGAGASLAVHVATAALRDRLNPPIHQLLIYPIAQANMETASYQEHGTAKWFGKATMDWTFTHVTRNAGDLADPRLDLAGRTDLAGLPPATIINAAIDPLADDGAMLADRLRAAQVPVERRVFAGVTHDFFGLVRTVAKAEEAQAFAAEELRRAFGQAAPTGTIPPRQP